MGAFLRIAPTDYETATVTGKIQPGGSPMEIPAAKPVKKSPAFSQSNPNLTRQGLRPSCSKRSMLR